MFSPASFLRSHRLLGRLRRQKLNVTSRFGLYYDVTTDFAFIMGIFCVFFTEGHYPVWLLLLIVASFVQFLVTSFYIKNVYDFVGKYFGSALYIGSVLTLICPTQTTFDFVKYAFVGFFLVSIASRIASSKRKHA
jgi:phosphatidylglycerophosphate synthase